MSFVWEFVWWFLSRANTMYWGHIQGNGRRGGQWRKSCSGIGWGRRVCMVMALIYTCRNFRCLSGFASSLFHRGCMCMAWGGYIGTQDRGQQVSEWFPRRCRFGSLHQRRSKWDISLLSWLFLCNLGWSDLRPAWFPSLSSDLRPPSRSYEWFSMLSLLQQKHRC